MDYEVYPDESKEAGYLHGILLVPAHKKAKLSNYLEKSRENVGYYHLF
jgi:hypothetical protein